MTFSIDRLSVKSTADSLLAKLSMASEYTSFGNLWEWETLYYLEGYADSR